MGKLEDTLAQGVKDGKIPHAVVFATNSDGSFTCKCAIGNHTLGEDKPIAEDTLFQLASQTKLLTSIAALQIVEKGLFGLDDDVSKILPELAEQPILKDFDENDKPVVEERKNTITFRILLTHTSGGVYDAADPLIAKYKLQQGGVVNNGATVQERFLYPLVFEPGSQFMYGTSLDWAGKLIERVTNQNLEDYMKKNIFEPLGVTGITFFPQKHPDLAAKIPQMTVRTPEGGLAPSSEPFINEGVKDAFGGHGAYGQMEQYLKIQRSILANDGKLLKPSTVNDFMFTPQLPAISPSLHQSLYEFRHHPMAAMAIGENDPEIESDWGIGGIIYQQDDIGRRKKGTLNWGGMPNTFWIIDREADLAFTFGTQVLPPGDVPTGQMIKEVELALYEMAGVKF